MRHPPPREMRLDSPELRAEQYRNPNQTCKEPRFSWLNMREFPSTLSLHERNTDVTSWKENSSVYPKSTWDEALFTFIGFIAITCSTAYSTSGLTSLRKLQRFSETPASRLYEYSFQHSSVKKVPCTTYRPKMRADSLSLIEDLSQLSTSTSSVIFPQQ